MLPTNLLDAILEVSFVNLEVSRITSPSHRSPLKEREILRSLKIMKLLTIFEVKEKKNPSDIKS